MSSEYKEVKTQIDSTKDRTQELKRIAFDEASRYWKKVEALLYSKEIIYEVPLLSYYELVDEQDYKLEEAHQFFEDLDFFLKEIIRSGIEASRPM